MSIYKEKIFFCIIFLEYNEIYIFNVVKESIISMCSIRKEIFKKYFFNIYFSLIIHCAKIIFIKYLLNIYLTLIICLK